MENSRGLVQQFAQKQKPQALLRITALHSKIHGLLQTLFKPEVLKSAFQKLCKHLRDMQAQNRVKIQNGQLHLRDNMSPNYKLTLDDAEPYRLFPSSLRIDFDLG